MIVLVPLAVYGSGLARDFDLLGDLPKSDETRQGFDVLADHFGPGQMQPLNVVAVDDAAVRHAPGSGQRREAADPARRPSRT